MRRHLLSDSSGSTQQHKNPFLQPKPNSHRELSARNVKTEKISMPQSVFFVFVLKLVQIEQKRERSLGTKKKNLTKLTLIVRCKFYSNFISLCAVALAKTLKLFFFVFLRAPRSLTIEWRNKRNERATPKQLAFLHDFQLHCRKIIRK